MTAVSCLGLDAIRHNTNLAAIASPFGSSLENVANAPADPGSNAISKLGSNLPIPNFPGFVNRPPVIPPPFSPPAINPTFPNNDVVHGVGPAINSAANAASPFVPSLPNRNDVSGIVDRLPVKPPLSPPAINPTFPNNDVVHGVVSAINSAANAAFPFVPSLPNHNDVPGIADRPPVNPPHSPPAINPPFPNNDVVHGVGPAINSAANAASPFVPSLPNHNDVPGIADRPPVNPPHSPPAINPPFPNNHVVHGVVSAINSAANAAFPFVPSLPNRNDAPGIADRLPVNPPHSPPAINSPFPNNDVVHGVGPAINSAANAASPFVPSLPNLDDVAGNVNDIHSIAGGALANNPYDPNFGGLVHSHRFNSISRRRKRAVNLSHLGLNALSKSISSAKFAGAHFSFSFYGGWAAPFFLLIAFACNALIYKQKFVDASNNYLIELSSGSALDYSAYSA